MASNENIADAFAEFLKSKGIQASDVINLLQTGNTAASPSFATSISPKSKVTVKEEKTEPATPGAPTSKGVSIDDKTGTPAASRVLRSSTKTAMATKSVEAKSPASISSASKSSAAKSGAKKRARASTPTDKDEDEDEDDEKDIKKETDNPLLAYAGDDDDSWDSEFEEDGKKMPTKKASGKKPPAKKPTGDKGPVKKRYSTPTGTVTRKPQGGLDPTSRNKAYDARAAYAKAVVEGRPPPHVGNRTSHAAARQSYDEIARVYRCQRGTATEPCSKTFTRVYDLTRHETTVHDKSDYFVCPLCESDDKKYGRVDALLRHFKARHPKINLEGEQGEETRRAARRKVAKEEQ